VVELPVMQVVSHKDVLEIGKKKAVLMKQLIAAIIDFISSG
jgi:hypothetical protein